MFFFFCSLSSLLNFYSCVVQSRRAYETGSRSLEIRAMEYFFLDFQQEGNVVGAEKILGGGCWGVLGIVGRKNKIRKKKERRRVKGPGAPMSKRTRVLG